MEPKVLFQYINFWWIRKSYLYLRLVQVFHTTDFSGGIWNADNIPVDSAASSASASLNFTFYSKEQVILIIQRLSSDFDSNVVY
jgi:hypothetical protein